MVTYTFIWLILITISSQLRPLAEMLSAVRPVIGLI